MMMMMMTTMMIKGHLCCDSCCMCNKERMVSLGQLDNVDFQVLLGPAVNLASMDQLVHKAILVIPDLRERRYLEVLEKPELLELLVTLDSKDLREPLVLKVRLVHKDSKELLDQLDGKDRRASLDSKDLRDKLAELDLQEVEVYTGSLQQRSQLVHRRDFGLSTYLHVFR